MEIKNFTQKDNGSIMNKSQSVYNTLRDTLKAEKTNMIKNPLYNRNPATASGKKSNEAINTPEYSTQKLNKTSGASLNQGLNAQSYIPKEKKEQERLKRLTGTHDLKKVEPAKLDNHIRLKNKTPDDYYDIKLPYYELNRRIDRDAFGPKTDFSINNFENNFDKMNLEEQSMMAYKMQREFNNLGYKDKDGYSLKTDGIFGDKTKYVYEQYKKDNYNELSDDFTEILFIDNEMSNIKKLGTVANDVAFVSQLTDAITPYEIEVNFYTRRKSQ